MIVADTSGIVALLDSDDKHHPSVRDLFAHDKAQWILPWAILPEVDYLATKYLGGKVARAFLADVRDGHFRVDATVSRDLPRAHQLVEQYADLDLGLVDAVVMAQAERLQASAIVTLDRRHFSTVKLALRKAPRLLPASA